LRFTPTSAGQYLATLTITTNESSGNVHTINLFGTGVTGGVSILPKPLDFGTVGIGSTKTLHVDVNNISTAFLKIVSASIAPGDPFVIATAPVFPVGIKAGDSSLIDISFTPQNAGVQTATLTVTIEDGATATVQLQGNGQLANGVATDSPDKEFAIQIQPNPAKNLASVHIDGAKGQTQLDMFDAAGRTVLSKTMAAADAALDLSGLWSGEYFVRATNSTGGIATGRLTIER
jgi:hypothetical protein